MTIISRPTSALRFVSSINTHRFQDPVRLKPMATKLEDTPIKGTGDENNRGDTVEAETIPAPPEKPEPGDCCGSGCVRCVWDVYYEELEAYNNLYSKESTPNSS
ncbi:putative Glutaredoxin-1, grx1 [Hibiscus syriacus]|uniref:Glutaredoxin-1, grx1 n=1 Tax=Hibiscus syriacus TaxID=106335 RepID=A0A6A3AXS9_HIBSY|nr:putative Glutaredoxin-1, grx1 [Hibiscus syriacus]